jgi:hypothetical protein
VTGDDEIDLIDDEEDRPDDVRIPDHLAEHARKQYSVAQLALLSQIIGLARPFLEW